MDTEAVPEVEFCDPSDLGCPDLPIKHESVANKTENDILANLERLNTIDDIAKKRQ